MSTIYVIVPAKELCDSTDGEYIGCDTVKEYQ